MKRVVLAIGLLLATLAIIPMVGESDADGPYDNQVSVTYMVGDKVYMVNIVDIGEKVSWVPPVPEGYTGWDTDLSQPVYEDTVVHAIPEGDHTLLYILIALTLAMLSVVIAVSNLRRM